MTVDPLADFPRVKAEIMRRAWNAYAAFDDAIDAVPEARMIERGAIGGGWSVKDVLAHTGSDDRWFAIQLEACRQGIWPTMLDAVGDESPPPIDIDLSTQDGRNEWQYRRNQGLSLDAVRQRSREWRARVRAAIEAISEEEFQSLYTFDASRPPGRIRPAIEDTDQFAIPLWQLVGGSTWQHYEQHAADIRAFLEQIGGN